MLSVLSDIFRARSLKNGHIVRRADEARDAKRYREAAELYEQVLAARPRNAPIHIQCGHMHKEAGNLEAAERHYTLAHDITPDDPDLALQLGHFYKVAGRLDDAERAYSRAIELKPGWTEPAIHLGELYRSGWNGRSQRNVLMRFNSPHPAPAGETSSRDHLVPELVPTLPENKLHKHVDYIEVKWLGHIERTYWGMRNVLRGVDAIRAICVSSAPIVEARALINGMRFFVGKPLEYPLKYEKYDHSKRKYVVNIWHDFSVYKEGECELQLQFIDRKGGMRIHNLAALIKPPLTEQDYPFSDRVVAAPAEDSRPLSEVINSLPSVIRPARRTRFPAPPRNVLVQRIDQLGDMVVSVPALRRLRELLPEARLVGLLSAANADLARSLKLFDDIVVCDFPDDEWERRRVMPIEKQQELHLQLKKFTFDVAIDLMQSNNSRPLLLLSGAPYLVGFRDDQARWLSAEFHSETRDPRNGLEDVSHSTRMMGFVEWFGTLLKPHADIVRRDDLSRDVLKPYGLAGPGRFAVLHTGARLKFSRWPHYAELARLIIDRTDLSIVMMADDGELRTKLPPDLLESARFQLIDKRLPFDEFDALLSFCAVFVGNDSGPSHLASMRGTNVVNLYLARHNWNEWGHEQNGYIISRRVPCAGCNIHHDPEECGKDYACIKHIAPEEVFGAVQKLI